MTNRISGDFGHEAMEAFRVAYAQQLQSPDEDSIANNSGLPTSTIANTSPWFEHVGIWKYPSGKGPDQDLKTAFDPNQYLSSEILEEDEESDSLSEDEVENLLNEIIGEDDEE